MVPKWHRLASLIHQTTLTESCSHHHQDHHRHQKCENVALKIQYEIVGAENGNKWREKGRRSLGGREGQCTGVSALAHPLHSLYTVARTLVLL